ncbi:MAG: hypothetical protein KO464_02945 [Candidatus Methanofastidiosum sp.]|nr:hypothetical protein [Methanofastidiosum sp.]
MKNKDMGVLRKSMLTKISGVFLIFLILAFFDFISVLVSYLIFHKLIGFLNNNFIVLTFLLVTILVGSIMKDISPRLKYLSPLFYTLGGLTILIIAINTIVDLEILSIYIVNVEIKT